MREALSLPLMLWQIDQIGIAARTSYLSPPLSILRQDVAAWEVVPLDDESSTARRRWSPGDAGHHTSHAVRLSMRLFPRGWTSYGSYRRPPLRSSRERCGRVPTATGTTMNCTVTRECLATNPTGAASGTSTRGPEEVNCTQLMVFASHFLGTAAFNSCDNSPPRRAGAAATYAPRISFLHADQHLARRDAHPDRNNFVVNGTTVLINGVSAPSPAPHHPDRLRSVPNVTTAWAHHGHHPKGLLHSTSN